MGRECGAWEVEEAGGGGGAGVSFEGSQIDASVELSCFLCRDDDYSFLGGFEILFVPAPRPPKWFRIYSPPLTALHRSFPGPPFR